jgi:hypothetical protein
MKDQQHYEIEIFRLGFGSWFSRVYIVHPNPFADPIRTQWFTRNTLTKGGAKREINRVLRDEAIISSGEPTFQSTITKEEK